MMEESTNFEKLSSGSVRSLLSIGLGSSSDLNTFDENVDLVSSVLKPENASLRRMMIDDLMQPVLSTHPGPLSFERLMTIDDNTLTAFAGKTILEVLTHSETTPDSLRKMAGYGMTMTQASFPESTQATGAIIILLAETALAVRFGKELQNDEQRSALQALKMLIETEGFPEAIRDETNKMCGGYGV